MSRTFRSAALSLALISAAIPSLRAQSFTAGIAGTISDPSGAPIPSVRLTATNRATNTKTETHADEAGRYLVPNLAPGDYQLEATANGFKTFVQSGINLAVGQQARLDFSLAVGELTENVTVEATVAAIDTSTSTIGKVVSNRAILNLPLNSRNIYSLIFLTPWRRRLDRQ